MLTFLLFHPHRHTVEDFFASWHEPGDPQADVRYYESLDFERELPGGAVIFTDHERFDRTESLYARWLAHRVARHPDRYLVLNHPAHVLDRFTLMRRLHARGLVPFAVHRIGAARSKRVRYPVFLRFDNDHRGARGGKLLHTPHEVERAMGLIPDLTPARRRRLMLVEYEDVRDPDGLYRKYAVQKIGPRLIPRHVLVSREWMTKEVRLVTPATVADEEKLISDCPFRAEIDEAFRIAGIDYGRIDFGIRDGRMLIWEINTNPVIMKPRHKTDPLRREVQAVSVAMMFEAFRALSDARPPSAGRPFHTPTSVVWKRLQSGMQARSAVRR
jgi:hypothetical protein